MKNETPMATDKPPRRPRDAAATAERIKGATVQLLAEKGFTGVGVNAVAAAAGVDKQLIYYHFGGLDGLIRQLGGELAQWIGEPLELVQGEPYGLAMRRLLAAYADALRANTLVQRLLAWELVEPTEALQELEQTRSKAMLPWVMQLRASAAPPPADLDTPAINAVLLAAVNYLALREHSVGSFAGVEFRSPEGAARIARALDLICARTYGAAAKG